MNLFSNMKIELSRTEFQSTTLYFFDFTFGWIESLKKSRKKNYNQRHKKWNA